MRLVEIYKCLCDETRLRILNLLTQTPLCVCHFQEILEMDQVPISKHLSYLREHHMVESRRHGQWVIYSLPSKRSDELDLQLRCLHDCVQSNPVFRNDLRRLRRLHSECDWVAEAVATGTKGRSK